MWLQNFATTVTTLILFLQSSSRAEVVDRESDGKALSLFNVVRFRNEPCIGDGTRNGTCYTSDECSSRDGMSDGTCADGFGVCCIFSLTCGGSSSENITYLTQAAMTTFTESHCQYTICKTSDNICRIRLDFTAFNLAGPAAGTTLAAGAATTNAFAIGDCITDSFSIGGGNVPVICGTNTGQHVYFDTTASDCYTANFNIGTGETTTSRSWDIRVQQYACGDEDSGGPPGCTQYFTTDTGVIQSFNFPTTTAIGAGATHLSSQNYQMCFRRNSGKCFICFNVAIAEAAGADIAAQSSFGLGVSSDALAKASTTCQSDYLEFNDFNTMAIASSATDEVATGRTMICGRKFNTADAATTNITLCTRRAPFRVRFIADADEIGPGTAAINSESAVPPGGIVGFKLNFSQGNC